MNQRMLEAKVRPKALLREIIASGSTALTM